MTFFFISLLYDNHAGGSHLSSEVRARVRKVYCIMVRGTPAENVSFLQNLFICVKYFPVENRTGKDNAGPEWSWME